MHLNVKALLESNSISKDMLHIWSEDVLHNWSEGQRDIGLWALSAIFKNGDEGVAIIDDKSKKLKAIAAYQILSPAQSYKILDKYLFISDKTITKGGYQYFRARAIIKDAKKSCYLNYLASNASGGGTEIIQYLIDKGYPVFLMSSQEGYGFYLKKGFIPLGESKYMYYTSSDISRSSDIFRNQVRSFILNILSKVKKDLSELLKVPHSNPDEIRKYFSSTEDCGDNVYQAIKIIKKSRDIVHFLGKDYYSSLKDHLSYILDTLDNINLKTQDKMVEGFIISINSIEQEIKSF